MPTEDDFQTVANTVCTSIEAPSVEGKIQIQSPTTFKPLPSRKIIVIKRNPNLMTKMDGETVVSVQNSVAKTASVERERERTQGEGTAMANKRLKMEELDESLSKRSGKMKPFRPEWLKMDIFKDWLAPDPDNICKARCVACNTVLNAGKSELEKHAVGAKHTNNLDVLKQSLVMQQMYNSANAADEEDADYDDDDDDEDYDEYLSENTGGDATNVGNGAQQQLFGGYTMQKKLDAFARIADSIDNLTSIVSSGFDRLAESNYTLAKTLSELMKK